MRARYDADYARDHPAPGDAAGETASSVLSNAGLHGEIYGPRLTSQVVLRFRVVCIGAEPDDPKLSEHSKHSAREPSPAAEGLTDRAVQEWIASETLEVSHESTKPPPPWSKEDPAFGRGVAFKYAYETVTVSPRVREVVEALIDEAEEEFLNRRRKK